MRFSGHFLSFVCLSAWEFFTFLLFSRTIGPLTRLDKKACYQEKRIFNSLNKRGRCISITASMCNEDWHGYDSKLFLDDNFNASICDHSSVQASSSTYPQIKLTVTYHWYFRIIYSQIWNIDSIGLMIIKLCYRGIVSAYSLLKSGQV